MNLKDTIRSIEDFPEKGIIFRDITTLLKNPEALRQAVDEIEAELAEIEKQIAEYDTRFASAGEYNADDYKAYDELKKRYDHMMHEWEKASYELDIVENN